MEKLNNMYQKGYADGIECSFGQRTNLQDIDMSERMAYHTGYIDGKTKSGKKD